MSFEHLKKTQKEVALRLEEEFLTHLIPQSVLFTGKPYTSRMTAALELALAFMGKESDFYSLDTQDLIILSNRDMDIRIRSAMNMYKKQRNQRSLNFLKQTLRIFLFSFHGALADSSDSSLMGMASDVNDHLYYADSEADEKKFESWFSQLEKLVNPLLQKTRKKAGFSIDNVRDITSFLQYDQERVKCVILENIEDVTPGAMNSILKILEEPPKNAHLILVSSNPDRILDTILSRVRKYELPQIKEEAVKSFLVDAFFADGKSKSLEEYFYTQSGFDFGECRRRAEEFLKGLLLEKKRFDIPYLTSLAAFLDEYGTYSLFASLLLSTLEELLQSGEVEAYRALKAEKRISLAYNEALVYNQSKRVFLDRLEREVRKV